ncbi:MAG: hypothetical protein JNL43_12550 [Flavobacteriales bacterium]|nr:hypothetical protein [Flavobacteriales bacterium]
MFTHTLFLAAALVSLSASPLHMPLRTCDAFRSVGGPPRISLADKDKGDISKAEWAGVRSIDLHGCVPDARITSLTICIKDCTGKDASAKGPDAKITSEMRTMISNLPAGTPFSVNVKVVDAKGKDWPVPAATFVWKG